MSLSGLQGSCGEGVSNGSLLYRASKPVNAIFVAEKATLLSYQLSALTFDLCFARRDRGRVPASDIHIQLLADERSPVAVAAVFRRDFLDRIRFHRTSYVPKDVRITRLPGSIPKRGLCKLAILLMAPVFFNLLCIYLALDGDEIISFAEVDFGGLAVGFNEDLSVLTKTSDRGPCESMHISGGKDLQAIASFNICFTTSRKTEKLPLVSNHEPGHKLSININRNGHIVFRHETMASSDYPESFGPGPYKWAYFYRHYAFILL